MRQAEREYEPLPRLSVIGLGKLGSPFAAVLAGKGFETLALDVNAKFVNAINSGSAPVAESQLQEFIERGKCRLRATSNYRELVLNSDVSFIIVPTPSDADGFFANTYVIDAVEALGAALREKDGYHLVVVTSTVMPGSTGGEIKTALERSSGRSVGGHLGLCYNPQFGALGSVIRDMLNPDFILIGESDSHAGAALASIHRVICDNDAPVRRMNFVNAELCKIAVNTYVTTKISYANMLASMCDHLPGADVDVVTDAVGSDSRVGTKYLRGAGGYGGPCFPRDNKAFAALGRRLGVRCDIAEATDAINDLQLERMLKAVYRNAPPGSKIAVLGLSYKPDSQVVEESQAAALAARLSTEGYAVTVYDPVAMPQAEVILGDRVNYASSEIAALEDVSLAVIATPWPQFKNALARVGDRSLTVIDPWRILEAKDVPDNVALVHLGFGGSTGASTDSAQGLWVNGYERSARDSQRS